MGKSLFAGVSFLDIDAHELADEILGRVADVVPVRRVEFKVTCKVAHNLSIKLLQHTLAKRENQLSENRDRVTNWYMTGTIFQRLLYFIQEK